MNGAKRSAILVCLLLASCDQSRSASYFEAHPDEARAVLKNCKAGTHRGPECRNAVAYEALERSRATQKVWDEMASGAGDNGPGTK